MVLYCILFNINYCSDEIFEKKSRIIHNSDDYWVHYEFCDSADFELAI